MIPHTRVLVLCLALATAVSAAPAAPATPAAPDSIAATVAGAAVTLDEVDRRAAVQLQRIRQEQYEQRTQALESILGERVLQREAEARHLVVDTLVAREVDARVVPPTKSQVDSFYIANRGQFYGKPVEEVYDRIAAALRQQKVAERRAVYVKALRKKYDVHMSLEPPRFPVTFDADDPARGPADAPVTVVEFSDYQCPYCVRAQQTIEDVVAKYRGKVRLVFRDFPLSIHPNAVPAAIAANCAREHGKYWEMARAMFADQSKLGSADLVQTAATLGMDSTAFRACMDSPEARGEVDHDTADGRALGISGTPTFYVNGVMIVGAREPDVFERAIDAELDRLHR